MGRPVSNKRSSRRIDKQRLGRLLKRLAAQERRRREVRKTRPRK